MILTLIEHEAGLPEDTSLEALTLARDVAEQSGAPLETVVFGDEGGAVADEIGAYGVGAVHAVSHPELDTYAPGAWAESIAQLVDELAPEAVVVPGSARGHEVLAHAAAKLDLAMAANCIEVETGDSYELTRQRWGGTLLEHARLSGETKLLSAAPNEISAEPADGGEAAVQAFEPDLAESDLRVQITRVEESDEEGIPLGEARTVVSGGRGVGSPEGFDKLEELADLLDAAIGSSRAAVNEGWRSHDDQIGQTGTKISPRLYMPCGISGAVQHMVGCKGAENIMAVNTDPEAAIIQKAEYAVIADLHEVVPELNDRLRGIDA
ncbi:MAG: electron transfer flavoprotein subunit alpha/FixB family protein [Halobacteriales archaeon SW_9_67_25]|jgi:electron transfer flavoprotein alpha subunit|nr:MAG: electron transfer flavoprotein subunit alpha/FixB family protein [Halobacteriales archaeon SW_9_67_25]